ncbi:MAG: outer membrane protein assembly factor BamD [Bacteroidales bacterium]|nr:outer membrane protein assembly factor BamD [Bacteroidales bacterium]MBN2817365.1 outer membrane protein assembly factor BamD [Bacteroidales bacterium]
MMVQKRLIIYLSAIALIFTSCTGYEKLLKSNDYKLKYDEAIRYYAEEDYYRAQTLFDQIAPVYRGAEQADSVYYLQAMCYFNQRDYILAGHYFSTFARTYGGSPFVEEADYMAAYCYYMNSPRPELDQENTVMAIQTFQMYLLKYPTSEKAEEARGYIKELQEKLVEKSFISARLYYDLEDYKASLVALNNSLLEYPESDHREQIMFMIVKSSYMLADGSIPSKQKERFQAALDEYYSFKAEYPESKYMREAERYFKATAKYLGGDAEISDDIEETSLN